MSNAGEPNLILSKILQDITSNITANINESCDAVYISQCRVIQLWNLSKNCINNVNVHKHAVGGGVSVAIHQWSILVPLVSAVEIMKEKNKIYLNIGSDSVSSDFSLDWCHIWVMFETLLKSNFYSSILLLVICGLGLATTESCVNFGLARLCTDLWYSGESKTARPRYLWRVNMVRFEMGNVMEDHKLIVSVKISNVMSYTAICGCETSATWVKALHYAKFCY